MPSPRAAKLGLIALNEPVCTDSRVSRTGPMNIMLEVSNKMGGLSYRPRDYIYIPRGYILALLKITKRR